MSGVALPLAAVETDGLRLSEDEVMAVIGVRRRPWPTTFLTLAEQAGAPVDDADGRRMVERGGFSLVARGLARVIDGRFVLSGALTRLLDPLDSPAHTVAFWSPSDSPADARPPVVRFSRHGVATFVDSAADTGVRTLRIASDDDCIAQLVASAVSVFRGPGQDTTAVHVVRTADGIPTATTVASGRVISREMTPEGRWAHRGDSPFLDTDVLVSGFARG